MITEQWKTKGVIRKLIWFIVKQLEKGHTQIKEHDSTNSTVDSIRSD